MYSLHAMKTVDVNAIFIREAKHIYLSGNFKGKLQLQQLLKKNFRDYKVKLPRAARNYLLT